MMLTPPPLPAWDALHPLVVHFPIALGLLAPLFVLAAVCLPRRAAMVSVWCGLVLLVAAVGSMFLATATGEAAEELVEGVIGGASATLERHEELAVTARTLFLLLAAVLGALQVALLLLGRRKPVGSWVMRGAWIAFLALEAPAVIVLVNAVHAGGELVHRHGIHAPMGGASGGGVLVPSGRGGHGEGKDD